MDCYTDHSAILDYLAQVEQEEQLRESLKNKSGIAALRVERGMARQHHCTRACRVVERVRYGGVLHKGLHALCEQSLFLMQAN